jgi:hypothetical protein
MGAAAAVPLWFITRILLTSNKGEVAPPFDRSADAAREATLEEAGQDTPGAVEKNH